MKQESLPRDNNGFRVYFKDVAVSTGELNSNQTQLIDLSSQLSTESIIGVHVIQDVTNPSAIGWFSGYPVGSTTLGITNDYVGTLSNQVLYVRLFYI